MCFLGVEVSETAIIKNKTQANSSWYVLLNVPTEKIEQKLEPNIPEKKLSLDRGATICYLEFPTSNVIKT